MSKSQPTWETRARIDGLPCTNWKKRTGVTMDGTLAECVARWLSLPGHQQMNCTFGWGPTADGGYGSWSALTVAAFVRGNGLPPTMATARGGQPGPEMLAKLTAMDRYDPPPGPGDTRPSPSLYNRPPR